MPKQCFMSVNFFLERGRDEEKSSKLRLSATQKVDYDDEEEDILTKIVKVSPDLENIKKNKILEAYNYFASEIKSNKLARDLDLIVDKIKENLMFILIETDTQEDGRKVFETI